jgi:hypothetical protein
MLELENKQVLVIGLGRPGQAACELLRRNGARVTGVDQANTQDVLNGANRLQPLGIEVTLGASAPPQRDFNLAVLSSTLPVNAPLVEAGSSCRRPAVIQENQTRVPLGRGHQRDLWRLECFYSLRDSGFTARSSSRSGEKCHFGRCSFAFPGLFELGLVSESSTLW